MMEAFSDPTEAETREEHSMPLWTDEIFREICMDEWR